MYELHKNEQYFFDAATLQHLTSFLKQFDKVGLLCAPMLGRSLVNEGHDVIILDIDERFSDLQGYLKWDIYRPQWLPLHFDIIVCDPPFFNVSLSQLFKAIRLLSQNNFDQKMMISYLHRRRHAIMGSFSPFRLEATGYFPSYVTVTKKEKNYIEFYSNLDTAAIRLLTEKS
jgi:hypothetical protein